MKNLFFLLILISSSLFSQNDIIDLEINRIAVIAGHRQNKDAPAFKKYFESKPEVTVWLGDNVYADTKTDPDFIKECYSKMEAKEYFRKLRDSSYFVVTWDDHDFGYNNEGKDYPLKYESKEIFRTFWKLEEKIPAERDGVYYAERFRTHGKILQIIMLDVRFNRDDPSTEGDVLGENQWKWFENELKKEADLRVVFSGFQILLDPEIGSETWSEFPESKKRLFKTIRNSLAENVLLFTGDQHYGEVNRQIGLLDFDAIELQFAGMNQIEDPEFNSYRVSPTCKSLNTYVYMDILWEKSKYEIPHILYKVIDADTDITEVAYRVNFDEIELNIDFTKNDRFADEQKIEMKHTYANLKIRYTTDGSEPDENSSLYLAPIRITETTTVKARFFDEVNKPRSNTKMKTYSKVNLSEPKLKSSKNLKSGIKFKYYEGKFEILPEFEKLNPKKTGQINSLNIMEIREVEDHYAILFEGFIKIERDGVYQFSLRSDDGSKLFIGNELIIDNDGSHSARKRTGVSGLKEGLHKIRLEYFEDYSGEELKIEFYKTGDTRNLFNNDLLYVVE